jgi:hypothetical protein
MLDPRELLHQLNLMSQISTVAEGEKESDDVTLVFENERMLVMMGEYDHVFQTEDPNRAIAIAALILQWASRKKRLEKGCACNTEGTVCMYHMNIDAQILDLLGASRLSTGNWG